MFSPSKCGLFPANFQPPLGRNFIWPAPLAEPRSMYSKLFQNSRATFASSPFSYRGKSRRVRLRGVDPKFNRKRPKEERSKNWFVLTEKSGAWLLVACCCCRGHATAPTHHIGRLCKRRALFVLARGELSGFLNTKLSVGGLFRRVLERGVSSFGEEISAFPLLQTRAQKDL